MITHPLDKKNSARFHYSGDPFTLPLAHKPLLWKIAFAVRLPVLVKTKLRNVFM